MVCGRGRKPGNAHKSVAYISRVFVPEMSYEVTAVTQISIEKGEYHSRSIAGLGRKYQSTLSGRTHLKMSHPLENPTKKKTLS